MKFQFDRSVRFFADSSVVLGGSPATLMRLGSRGAQFVRQLRADGLVEPVDDAFESLAERFVAGSILHPLPEVSDHNRSEGSSVDDITVVIPVRDRPAALETCLAALRSSGIGRLLVIDDGSNDGAAHAEVAHRYGAAVIRSERSQGPAAARNLGAASVTTGLVAFVDSDVEVAADWTGPILAHLWDERVSLVAPRVRSGPPRCGPGAVRPSLIDRYESVASPLDMGAEPAPIKPNTRVSYVPSAALCLRTELFHQLGGFDEALSVGEDVDFLWRLHDAGCTARYEPRSLVHHAGRATVRDTMQRRFDYGTSAALLEQRHRGRVSPARIEGTTLGAWLLMATRLRPLCIGVFGWNAARVYRSLNVPVDRRRVAAAAVLGGHRSALRQLARLFTRPLFPLSGGLLIHKKTRRWAVLGTIASLVIFVGDTKRRSPDVGVSPVLVMALGLLDDLCYSAGVWSGAISQREPKVLMPSFSVTEGRRDRPRS